MKKLDKITTKFKKAKEKLLDVDYEKAQIIIDKMILLKDDNKTSSAEYQKLYERAYQHLTLSERIEERGVWHRPCEESLEELIKMLDDLKSININGLYVETFFNGFTIYPSKVMPYHPNLNNIYGEYGNDYLKALIAEASKREIQIHAWVENFFVGGKDGLHSDLWEKNPEWQIVNYNQLNYQTGKPGNEEEGFLFFDPANIKAQDLILKFYKELISNYEIVGIQLDYIRYPSANENYIYSSGYTEYAINKFKDEYQLEIENIFEYVKQDENYQLWNKWRQGEITKFVKRVYQLVSALDKNILLSIAVGPEINYAKTNLMQDWGTWVVNGWIDIVAPMAYVESKDFIKFIINKLNETTKGLTYNYTGIAPTYHGLPDILNTYFIDESNKCGALGSIIFAYHNLVDNIEVKETLIRGTHRHKAISPHQEVSKLLEVLIADIKEKAINIYLDSGLITAKTIDKLIKILNSKYQNLTELKQNVELAIDYINKKDNIVSNNIIEMLKRFMKIINIKEQRCYCRKESKDENIY